MANVYVWSGATGAGTGADWANAGTNIGTVSAAAGDVIWVAHDHAQTQASALTVNAPGTEASPNKVYCVDRAGSVPPVAADLRTTATITTTGAFAITISGTVSEWYGISFICGSGATSANLNLSNTGNRLARFTNCKFKLGTTASASRMNPVVSGGHTIWDNCTVEFGNVSQLINVSARLVWKNTGTDALVSTGSIPTALLATNGAGSVAILSALDLDALGSGKNIFNSTTQPISIGTVEGCKLGASVALAPAIGTTWIEGSDFLMNRCDSGDTTYRCERINYKGVLTTETTIVRTGGANDGTTALAWKIVTTANSKWEYPFECLPITVWNDTIGSSITVTVEGIWGGGAVPLNSEIWIECEYLGTSGFPLSAIVTSGTANGLATGSNIPAGSGTWGGSTTQFAMACTFTPQEKGPIKVVVKAAKPSSTFYVDPKPVVT